MDAKRGSQRRRSATAGDEHAGVLAKVEDAMSGGRALTKEESDAAATLFVKWMGLLEGTDHLASVAALVGLTVAICDALNLQLEEFFELVRLNARRGTVPSVPS
jgi:hypothetical protein